MKHAILSFSIVAMTMTHGYSQLLFQITGGVSPKSNPVSAGVFINRHLPHEEFVFNMHEVKPQVYAGMKARVELEGPFFMDVGLKYTKRTSTYHLEYTMIDFEHPVSDYFMTESDHVLLLPVNIGVSLGALNVTSGLRGMRSIFRNNDLNQLTGFSGSSYPIYFGFQGGITYQIGRSGVGVEYYGNFSRVGSGMSVNGQSLELMNVPGQFLLTIQHNL